MTYCKHITKNHCNNKCLERHTKTLFVKPFRFLHILMLKIVIMMIIILIKI